MEDWTGILRLDTEVRSGKTVARNVYFQGAYKVMRPIYHDESGQVCYYILNPGGGYLDGDSYKMQITLDKQAQLTLTTQSATKIYKTPHTLAYQETVMDLKEGSYLEYIPDPIIGYRDARYKQKTNIHMEKGAALFYSDIITPGWSPSGERFSYNTLQLINEIYMDNELAVYDHVKLNPATKNMDGLGQMEGFSHLGSLIVIGEKTDSNLIDKVYQAIHKDSTEFKIGLSELPIPGFTLRVLANSTQTIEKIVADCQRIINEEWLNKTPSFLRKY
ncbi:urease accessory protein UreD [Filibacter tadaridae]|uniref:Urease accessory protein UreD n=1 Tax=Filibacter tadaridae TaxID=2483811 RepID=A0A3P5X9T8_9BACL|nr:urease accessory protein UreD [Filibacter tadaridae]VDC24204.1 Urease accessory protein UreD [Filibacter tadaridae]